MKQSTKIGIVVALTLASVSGTVVYAQEASCPWGNFEAPLPGFEGKSICDVVQDRPFLSLVGYIATFLLAATVSAGVIAVVVAGYMYMTAGGSGDRVNSAKKVITSALLGIALALTAYLILVTISGQFAPDNPANEPTLILRCTPGQALACPCNGRKPNGQPCDRLTCPASGPNKGICPKL